MGRALPQGHNEATHTFVIYMAGAIGRLPIDGLSSGLASRQ